jgi:hypothetical protein
VIRPYTRKLPPTRREAPAPPAATPLSPNAAWLDSAAAYWQAQGCVLVWHWHEREKRYTSFYAYEAPNKCVGAAWIGE